MIIYKFENILVEYTYETVLMDMTVDLENNNIFVEYLGYKKGHSIPFLNIQEDPGFFFDVSLYSIDFIIATGFKSKFGKNILEHIIGIPEIQQRLLDEL